MFVFVLLVLLCAYVCLCRVLFASLGVCVCYVLCLLCVCFVLVAFAMFVLLSVLFIVFCFDVLRFVLFPVRVRFIFVCCRLFLRLKLCVCHLCACCC